jgi:hypothetical protein
LFTDIVTTIWAEVEGPTGPTSCPPRPDPVRAETRATLPTGVVRVWGEAPEVTVTWEEKEVAPKGSAFAGTEYDNTLSKVIPNAHQARYCPFLRPRPPFQRYPTMFQFPEIGDPQDSGIEATFPQISIVV